jgi:hypothetical protein
VTSLDPGLCKSPTIAGKPVRFLEGRGPLARLGGEFGAGVLPLPIAEPAGELVALSLAGTKPTLEVSLAASVPGTQKVIAALGPAASGAPLFDRRGRLVGFAGPVAPAPRRAGVTLAAPHAIVRASALGETPAAPGSEGALTAAEIAKLRRRAVVGVFCAS